MSVQCFLLEPTELSRISLRRFEHSAAEKSCPGPYSYHNAMTLIEAAAPRALAAPRWPGFPHSDERWPKVCTCGYVFVDDDEWQVFEEHLYRRSDTQELASLHNPPVGAIWNCPWMPDSMKKADGLCLCCQTPGGQWCIDGQASNCTRPREPHDCWVRHGVPPHLHVDKNGNTCNAGAGSIVSGGWHGFLHHGELVTA